MDNLYIILKKIRENNLKGIDVKIPIGKMTIITGPSGAGKSSLAMDVLFAEGHYRYLESLSQEAKSLIGLRKRPDAARIRNLPPPLALSQAAPRTGSASTVATLTDLSNLIRMLYAACGIIHCPKCGKRLDALTIDQIVNRILSLPQGSKLHILAPVKRSGNLGQTLSSLQSSGFLRVRIDGNVTLIESLSSPGQDEKPSSLEVVVDRIVLKKGMMSRIAESVSLALRIGNGHVMVEILDPAPDTGGLLYFSDRLACQRCGITLPEPTPGMFAGRIRKRGGTELKFLDSITILNLNYQSAISSTIAGAKDIITEIREKASVPDNKKLRNPRAAEKITNALLYRLTPLMNMGLGHLPLDRATSDVSTGELQRLRLAAQLGKDLTGVLYILDEPSIGLHPSEQEQLIKALNQLKARGNTLVIVEHTLSWLNRADHVIELGPGSGDKGGEVLYTGAPEGLLRAESTITGPYLSGKKRLNMPQRKTSKSRMDFLHMKLEPARNLRTKSINIPQNAMILLTGPSGSGKSTLLRAIKSAALNTPENPTAHMMEQSPITGMAVSLPVTYTGIFPRIRELFSSVPDARSRGYRPGYFSLAKKGGRCEACRGRGFYFMDLKYLPPVKITCDICGGRRYHREALAIRYRGLNIHEVLQLTVQEAARFFSRIPSIRRPLEALISTGLGYLRLGQPTGTLSGGENQRLKLAKELAAPQDRHCLYLLDEPTKGLHLCDIQRLLVIMTGLLEKGHGVIMASNLKELSGIVDWIIELGPGGGPKGGRIVFEGPPHSI